MAKWYSFSWETKVGTVAENKPIRFNSKKINSIDSDQLFPALPRNQSYEPNVIWQCHPT